MLRSTGRAVQLKLVRYLHGFKFEQLQQAIANSTNPLAYSANTSTTLAFSSPVKSSSSVTNIGNQEEEEEEVEDDEFLPPPVRLFHLH